MDSKRLRFGLIGVGQIGRAYAQALGGSRAAVLVAAADLDLEALHAPELGDCHRFASAAEMIGSAELDAAVLCTPPSSHESLCLQLIAAGIPVLCEKPFSTSPSGGAAVVAAARAAALPVSMASKFRSVEGIQKGRDLLRSGALGAPRRLEIVFASRVQMAGRWHCEPAISGGGVLMDNGPHAVDLVRFLLGPVTEVLCVEGERPQGLGVEESVHLETRGVDGGLATIDLSWSEPRDGEDFLRLDGNAGTLRVGWRDTKYRLATDDGWTPVAGAYDKIAALRGQIEAFTLAVRGEPTAAASPHAALASVRVIAAAYASMASGRWLPVAGAEGQRDKGTEGQRGKGTEGQRAEKQGTEERARH